MKVTIRDPETFRALLPSKVMAYLYARSWVENARIHDAASIWVQQDYPDMGPEIILPLDRNLGDYTARMADMLQTLEAFEDRSQLEIIRDIAAADGDVIRIRLDTQVDAGGTVPLQTGVSFVNGVKDMLAAAACSAADPRPYYAARHPGKAEEYLGTARLGQTEQGSYVVTVVSRVPPGQILLEGGHADPFERQVVVRLVNGLVAAKTAADSATEGDVSSFVAAVPLGVSANLCDALTEMTGDGQSNIDVTVSWATTWPPAPDVTSRVEIPRESVKYFQQASRALKDSAPADDFVLVGAITKLARESKSGPGEVSVYGSVHGKSRHVSILLCESDYSRACDAHDQGKTVMCSGTLVKEGRTYRLRGPSGFDVMPDEP